MIIRFPGALVPFVNITIMGFVPEGVTVGFLMTIPHFRLPASAKETELGNGLFVHLIIALTRQQIKTRLIRVLYSFLAPCVAPPNDANIVSFGRHSRTHLSYVWLLSPFRF